MDLLIRAKDRPADALMETTERHPTDEPYSFACGVRSSREWLKEQNAQLDSGEWLEGKRLHSLRWSDPETSHSCVMELVEFREFPAMERVLRLRNDGAGETAPITPFKALDTCWKCAKDGEMPELRRSSGSDGRYDDFHYVIDAMRQSQWDATRTIRMDSANHAAFRKVRNGSPASAPVNCRKPSTTWLPFLNLRTGDDGILCAVGWAGQWFAEFAHDGKGKTTISAGMEHLDLKLRPGTRWSGDSTWLAFLLSIGSTQPSPICLFRLPLLPRPLRSTPCRTPMADPSAGARRS